MKLIAGLGNPGDQYQNNRHNFGFMALDYFQTEAGFSPWQEKSKALVSEGLADGEKIILAKPQTFMNLSGQAVGALTSFYKIAPEDILVVHDDIDLPLGVLRLAQNSGSAGHKGVESIIKNLGTRNFSRLRLGIKSSETKSFWGLFKKSLPAEKFVLQNFSQKELDEVNKIIKKSAEAIKTYLTDGLKKTQIQFNN